MTVTKQHIDQAIEVAAQHGATRVILFGSALEHLDKARDLDLAIEGVPGWEFYGLVADMQSRLPVPVDIVSLDTSKENHILREIRTYGRVIFDKTTQDELHES